MSNGKSIEIRIAATGGDQAASEVRKVGSATESTTEGVEDLKKELGPVAKALDDVGKKGGQAADDLRKIKDVQVGAAVGEVKEKISEFAAKIAELGPELDAVFGAEVAGKIRNVATTIQEVADAGSAIAAGFAAGGPVGGAVAGLGIGLAETGKAWVQMRVAQEGATASADMAAEMQAKLNKMLEDGVESQEGFTAAVLSSEIAAEFERQSEALKGLLAELDSVRKITAAEDKVAAAKRDNADAEAIRAGANPEDVKAKRTQDDAALAKSRIDYELNNEKKLLLEKQRLADEASGGLERLKADQGASPEQIQEAEAILEKAKKIAADAERKFADRTALAPLEKEVIDTKAGGRLADLNASKNQRLQKEREAEEKRAADEKARLERESSASFRSNRGTSGGYSSGSNISRPGAGDSSDDEPRGGGDPFRKLSAIEDNNRRAALRAKDREDRAGARQRDREERGGRKPGSLELRDRDEEGGIPQEAVDQFRQDVQRLPSGGAQGGGSGQMGEVLSLMKELSSAVAEKGGGGGGGKDYSAEIKSIKQDIATLRELVRNK